MVGENRHHFHPALFRSLWKDHIYFHLPPLYRYTDDGANSIKGYLGRRIVI